MKWEWKKANNREGFWRQYIDWAYSNRLQESAAWFRCLSAAGAKTHDVEGTWVGVAQPAPTCFSLRRIRQRICSFGEWVVSFAMQVIALAPVLD